MQHDEKNDKERNEFQESGVFLAIRRNALFKNIRQDRINRKMTIKNQIAWGGRPGS